MLWLRLFLPFAGAYFLSYLYRTANAVIGPVLADELKLGAGDLGLLTSAYFLAFAAAQLPLGMLLDRFGARRVEAALLLFAAAGAAAFAFGQSIAELAAGRGLIGLGVSACLMAAFKAFSLSFPAERQASLTGWIMTSGGLGALAATAPLEAALQLTGWRDIFIVLAGLTLIVAAWLFASVPEAKEGSRPEPLASQWAGVRAVFGSGHFWRFAPLGLSLTGGFMAVQSLWSISWLMQVNGYTRTMAAEHMAGMSLAMLLAYVLIGLLATALARRGIKPVQLLGAGLSLSLVTLALIISEAVTQSHLLWLAYGTFSSFGTLAYSQAAAGFPLALSGRANTAFNLMVFIGAFGVQWGLGLLIDSLQAYGQSVAMAHRSAFFVLFAAQAAALAWFWIAGRRPR
ncbi:MAG TPA: MFS transporter [Candidatus Accumulibacter phosphatis]|nr:MAG: putative sulfoacetate transporter SauU [Candidatus Accumulibacter sp. SK-11]HAY26576.1 MFS transporter [Accumulibacter sp.]HRL75074.1 MFS transporter [Candidatus Accumulibacter phosphatis]HCN68028.1 MFS transporter [Accumulibacter sp.]HCV12239.1 MFS transporter [Accumulibacter sp.]